MNSQCNDRTRRERSQWHFWIAGLAFAFHSTVTQAAPDAAGIEIAMAAATFPGACAARVDGEKVTYQRTFGYADVATRTPYAVDTVQPVGSVSKTVIGLTLLRAVQTGRLSLDDLDAPVSRWLDFPISNPRHPRVPITLRQLATHTSGIVDEETSYVQTTRVGLSRPDRSLRKFLRGYLSKGGDQYRSANFAAEPPGAAFHYSNVGSSLAALVVERIVGEDFAVFSEREVLVPLALNDSGWFSRSDQQRREATLYSPLRQPLQRYTSWSYPDGSLRTTCADLTKLLQAWMRAAAGDASSPLPSNLLRTWTSPQFSDAWRPAGTAAREPNHGLFFSMRADGSVGHSGSDFGVSAFVFFDPKRNLGRLFMTNIDIQEDPRLQAQFARVWKALGDN